MPSISLWPIAGQRSVPRPVAGLGIANMKAHDHDVDEYPFKAILKVSAPLAFGFNCFGPNFLSQSH